MVTVASFKEPIEAVRLNTGETGTVTGTLRGRLRFQSPTRGELILDPGDIQVLAETQRQAEEVESAIETTGRQRVVFEEPQRVVGERGEVVPGQERTFIRPQPGLEVTRAPEPEEIEPVQPAVSLAEIEGQMEEEIEREELPPGRIEPLPPREGIEGIVGEQIQRRQEAELQLFERPSLRGGLELGLAGAGVLGARTAQNILGIPSGVAQTLTDPIGTVTGIPGALAESFRTDPVQGIADVLFLGVTAKAPGVVGKGVRRIVRPKVTVSGGLTQLDLLGETLRGGRLFTGKGRFTTEIRRRIGLPGRRVRREITDIDITKGGIQPLVSVEGQAPITTGFGLTGEITAVGKRPARTFDIVGVSKRQAGEIQRSFGLGEIKTVGGPPEIVAGEFISTPVVRITKGGRTVVETQAQLGVSVFGKTPKELRTAATGGLTSLTDLSRTPSFQEFVGAGTKTIRKGPAPAEPLLQQASQLIGEQIRVETAARVEPRIPDVGTAPSPLISVPDFLGAPTRQVQVPLSLQIAGVTPRQPTRRAQRPVQVQERQLQELDRQLGLQFAQPQLGAVDTSLDVGVLPLTRIGQRQAQRQAQRQLTAQRQALTQGLGLGVPFTPTGFFDVGFGLPPRREREDRRVRRRKIQAPPVGLESFSPSLIGIEAGPIRGRAPIGIVGGIGIRPITGPGVIVPRQVRRAPIRQERLSFIGEGGRFPSLRIAMEDTIGFFGGGPGPSDPLNMASVLGPSRSRPRRRTTRRRKAIRRRSRRRVTTKRKQTRRTTRKTTRRTARTPIRNINRGLSRLL